MFENQIFKAIFVHILVEDSILMKYTKPQMILGGSPKQTPPKSLCKHQLCSNSPRPGLEFIVNKYVLFLTVHIEMV